MTRTRALVLVFLGAMLTTTVAMLSLAALGVRGEVLSLSAIIPCSLAAMAVARIVMHFDEPDRPRR
jgi:uncharacterized protein involved in response to NO